MVAPMADPVSARAKSGLRVVLLGATGTAGRATLNALLAADQQVTCVVRRPAELPPLANALVCEIGQAGALQRALSDQDPFDALVSCLASRSGAPEDAWAVDYGAHSQALKAAQALGIGQFILLSALCVQKPKLAFQQAKLAFEAELIASGLRYSIVRPTAFFKSLSGQIARVRDGKPFLLFGDGRGTACKPISDADLGRYMAECLRHEARFDQILPIGGPGPAQTPREQGEMLFELLDLPPRFRRVPYWVMDAIVGGLSTAGYLSRKAADQAELARIGRYYARESMLVWDDARQCYDADATPETGSDTLRAHYAKVIAGEAEVDLGAHAVF